MNLQLARILANMNRRAETLVEDGYRIAQETIFTNYFSVDTPEGKRYTVKVDEFNADRFSCTCPAFENYGDCKHHLAIGKMIARMQEDDAADAAFALHQEKESYEAGEFSRTW
jgi:hypothetical protein